MKQETLAGEQLLSDTNEGPYTGKTTSLYWDGSRFVHWDTMRLIDISRESRAWEIWVYHIWCQRYRWWKGLLPNRSEIWQASRHICCVDIQSCDFETISYDKTCYRIVGKGPTFANVVARLKFYTLPYPEPVYTGWSSVHWNITGMPLVDPVYTGIPLGHPANSRPRTWP